MSTGLHPRQQNRRSRLAQARMFLHQHQQYKKQKNTRNQRSEAEDVHERYRQTIVVARTMRVLLGVSLGLTPITILPGMALTQPGMKKNDKCTCATCAENHSRRQPERLFIASKPRKKPSFTHSTMWPRDWACGPLLAPTMWTKTLFRDGSREPVSTARDWRSI